MLQFYQRWLCVRLSVEIPIKHTEQWKHQQTWRCLNETLEGQHISAEVILIKNKQKKKTWIFERRIDLVFYFSSIGQAERSCCSESVHWSFLLHLWQSDTTIRLNGRKRGGACRPCETSLRNEKQRQRKRGGGKEGGFLSWWFSV